MENKKNPFSHTDVEYVYTGSDSGSGDSIDRYKRIIHFIFKSQSK